MGERHNVCANSSHLRQNVMGIIEAEGAMKLQEAEKICFDHRD